jgi:hypothetical protein
MRLLERASKGLGRKHLTHRVVTTAIIVGLTMALAVAIAPAVLASAGLGAVGANAGGQGATSLTTDAFTVTSVIGTPGSVDVGQGVAFSATYSGGFPVSWAWSGLPAGCSSSDTGILACIPSGSGTTTVTLFACTITVVCATNSLSYTVYPDPSILSFGPTSADQNQLIALDAPFSGGLGPYSATFSGLPGCTGTFVYTSSPAVNGCSPTTVGTFTSKVSLTDSNGFVVSDSVTFVVSSPLGAPAPTASLNPIDQGQSVTFTASPTGGSGGNTFVWGGLPSGPGCAGGSGDSVGPCVPSTASTYTIGYTVTDSNGASKTSATLTFKVYSALTATLAAPSPNEIDVGQTAVFVATAGGGDGPGSYTWGWSGLPTGCTETSTATTDTQTCVPTTSSGSPFHVKATVTDLIPNSVTSNSVTLKVDPLPTVTIHQSTDSVDLGQIVTFLAVPSGGSGFYSTYTWSAQSGLLCNLHNAPVLKCLVIGFSNTQVMVTVTDSFGVTSVSATSVALTVYTDPSVAPPASNHNPADLGQSIVLSTAVSGGKAPYTYYWYGDSGNWGCNGITSSNSLTCAATVTGSQTEYVCIIDANGYEVCSIDATIMIDPALTGSLSGSTTSIDYGQTVVFSAAAGGGSGSYSFTWGGLPGGCVSSGTPTTSVETCTPTSGAGLYTVSVTVGDTNGNSVTPSSVHVHVYTDPAAGAPSPSSGDVGQTIWFDSAVWGGLGPYHYAWAGLPKGCVSSNADPLKCKPTSTLGSPLDVTVTVTDANGYTVTSTSTPFTVSPQLDVTAGANHGSAKIGSSVNFYATVTGGSGGYTYAWHNLPAGCTAYSTQVSFTCVLAGPTGTFHISVKVTDSNGNVITSKAFTFKVTKA